MNELLLSRMAFAPDQTNLRGDVLVVVFLRGAADVLNLVVPYGEDALYALRPTLAIARPDDGRTNHDQRAINLDGFFGLHPLMAPLLPAWEDAELAVVHACGAPDESRSHFRAMELMERGIETESGPATGWIGRHLAALENDNSSPLRAVGLGEMVPRSLYGSVPAAALRSIADFHLGGDPQSVQQMRAALSTLYTGNDPLNKMGRETIGMLDTIQKIKPPDPAQSAYPDSDFGRGLQQVALLVKAQVGLEVVAIDLGGWDTHFAQGVHQGIMPNLIKDLAQGLAVFHAELTDHWDKLTLVVMTEFGRRVYENASLGTDHGHGGMMLLMGGHVAGGKVHGRWPGLEDGELFGPGDLAVTTDYRDVLAEILLKRMHTPQITAVFPGYTANDFGFLEKN